MTRVSNYLWQSADSCATTVEGFSTTKTLVIGLGNPILTDDGAGILAARLVAEQLPPNSNVDVIELAVGGLSLMEAMVDYERVILLDALYAPDGLPGQVVQFSAGELPETLNSASAHDVNLPTALRLGRDLGAKLPSTAAIQVVGVYAQEVLTFGDTPTPLVAAAIPEMARLVLRLLETKTMISPEILRRFTLFAGLDAAELKEIALVSEEINLKAGAWLFKEGDAADDFYLIVSGKINLMMNMDASGDHQFELDTLVRADALGLSALIEPHIYQMGALAGDDSRLVKIDAQTMTDLLAKYPQMGYRVMTAVARMAGERLNHLRVRFVSLVDV